MGKRTLIILLSATLVCLLLFINKPFHVDDSFFMLVAKQITLHPFDFYGFKLHASGTVLPAHLTTNPPLVSYYIALVAYFFGWNESVLHLAFLVPACTVVLGSWLLARELCSSEVAATLAVICTPAFLVSATNVMPDVMMLSFWVFAVYYWRKGLKNEDHRCLAIASVLIILGFLTKYSAVCLLPLLLAYSLVEKRRIGVWILFLVLPVVAIALYEWLTYYLYGVGQFSVISTATTASKEDSSHNLVTGVITGLSFVGGCVLFPMFHSVILFRKVTLLIIFALVLLVLTILMSLGVLENYPIAGADGINWWFVAQLSIFVFSGVCFFVYVFVDLIDRRDSDALLLFLWVSGTFLFASVVNWSVNGRSILPIVPVAGILVARYVERVNFGPIISNKCRLYASLVLTLVIGMSVTYADYGWATASKNAARKLSAVYEKSPGALWYEGHWGFQYYMDMFGRAKPIDYEKLSLSKDDIVFVPSFNTHIKPLYKSTADFIAEYDFSAAWFISTMNLEYGAGFYSDVFGPLPFAFVPSVTDKYYVYSMAINKTTRFTY